MSTRDDHPHQPHVPAPGESTIPELEDDETIAPRPEEEIADRARAKPDTADHSHRRPVGETRDGSGDARR